jgi:hypothetical protein
MRPRSVPILVTAVLAVLLAACAEQPDGAQPSPSPTTGPGATGEPPATPSPTASPPGQPTRRPVSPPVQPTPTGKLDLLTLTGEVYAGVEAGCTLIATGSGDYLLIGRAADQVRMGRTVTVRGVVRPDLMTTCQQGTPFEVREVLD